MMKRFAALCLAAVLALSLTACGGDSTGSAAAAALSFGDAISFDRMEEMAGQKVTIVGYMATMSPISGEFMYLMNLPYQSCPFCVPNTTQLANTMKPWTPPNSPTNMHCGKPSPPTASSRN